MRAQIVKINPKTVVIKSEKGKFATISKTKLDFKYELGDVILLEKNEDEVYFLPGSASGFSSGADFWGDTSVSKESNDSDYSNGSLIGGGLILLLWLVGWFIAYRICFWISVALLVYALSSLKNVHPKDKVLAIILLAIGAAAWVIEVMVAAGAGI